MRHACTVGVILAVVGVRLTVQAECVLFAALFRTVCLQYVEYMEKF